MSDVMTLINKHDFAIAIGIAISTIYNKDMACIHERANDIGAIKNLYLIYLDHCIEQGIENPYALGWFERWDNDNTRRTKRIKELEEKGEL